MYFVYILKLKGDKTYIGYTNDLRRRIKEHQKKNQCRLIYYEAFLFEKQARDRERKLKYYGSAWQGLKNRVSI